MMVRALDHQPSTQKTPSFSMRRMYETQGRTSRRFSAENVPDGASAPKPDRVPDLPSGAPTKSPRDKYHTDIEMMKDRFAKLLLGEDMSGGGKGVSSALALSNAITNLAASVFGEQRRLEPMAPETKTRWRKEIDWLLSVTDHIVELVPSQQSNNGVTMEIMTTRQRSDLLMNIPALRKLDALLIEQLDQFGHQNEFWYASGDKNSSEGRNGEKWWMPVVKVPPEGLSESTRRWLQSQKDSVNQVLKAAMAINAQVLSEMEIPENYIESLPKNGRESLGDSVYKSITLEYFDPDQFLSYIDISTEHKVLDLKDRIEASIVIWKRKMIQKDGKSSWSSGVSLEKRELFEERAETILLIIKQRFPGIPQSALDISKIQYNKDVGQAILESYSRVIESLAFTILSRIEDVIYSDSVAKNENDQAEDEMDSQIFAEPTSTMTLSDFMGWDMGKGESAGRKSNVTSGDARGDEKRLLKPVTTKKFSYLEKLESLRSPTCRH
ncbi:rop guanine nucleotide exchange factor 12 [Euphorbia lathyris]|uniref:rop guanine nucleotide exchange factor 12 n=1 Tax=Euphorbia lathyris TaxID=212925 RepID=UPI003313E9FA